MHWIASDGRQRTPGGGIQGSKGSVTPMGVLHAVDSETNEVMCGLPLDGLYKFPDVAWTKVRVGKKCQYCSRKLGA